MHQFGFSIWGYTTIRSKNKISKLRIFKLCSQRGLGTVCVCVGGGRGAAGGGRGRTYSIDNLPVCGMIICFIK